MSKSNRQPPRKPPTDKPKGIVKPKRIVKNPEIRRNEILEAARELFETIGYEKTPVEAIIKKVGIAKGTFYYYFKTKEEILEALVDTIGKEWSDHFTSILENKKYNGIKKFQLMLRGPEKKKMGESSILKIIHTPENRELQERLNICSIREIFPIMTKTLEQAFHEGYFKTELSLESVQIIFAGAQFILDSGLFELTPKQVTKYLEALQYMFETLGGAKPGLLDFIVEKPKKHTS